MKFQYSSHQRAEKVQASLHICPDLPEPSLLTYPKYYMKQGFLQQFWERAPGKKWEKMIDLTSKLGEINDIEHNKGSKK